MLLNLFVMLAAVAVLWLVNVKSKLDRLPKVGFSVTIVAAVMLWLIVGAAP